MLSPFSVAVILTFIWLSYYLFVKRYVSSSKFFFFLLFLMSTAGLIVDIHDYIEPIVSDSYYWGNIVLFAFLIILAYLPWYYFDKWFKQVSTISVNPQYYRILRKLFKVFIILNIYAIIYSLPYAIQAMSMGAREVRDFIREESIFPNSPLTTIAVGIGLLSPIAILIFYISLLDKKFSGYRKFLLPCTFTYIVTSMPFTARDGFIYLPLLHIFFYQIFRHSLEYEIRKKMTKLFFIISTVLLSFFSIITLDRFVINDDSSNSPLVSLIGGTWGYFFQQPYVFDQTIQFTTSFQGLSHRFPLLAMIFEGEVQKTVLYNKYEWMFGTMFANFYSAKGWISLFTASAIFFLLFKFLVAYNIKNKHFTSLFIVFSIYLYFLITGLFYFRLNSSSIIIMYSCLIIMSFFIRRILLITLKKF